MHLKDDMHNYLEENEIRKLIKKHNQFIDYPIYLQTFKTRDVVEESSAETETDDIKVEDIDNETKKETKTETYVDWEHINSEKPLWTRNPKDITHEQYASFYKTVSGDYEEHLDVTHFSVEGQLEFKGILFIPKKAPFDMFNEGLKKPNNIKLYVRRVFITDNCEDLVPEYLRFVKGVIDSEDLPLNISREMLQQNKIMKVIKKNITKKTLELFTQLSENYEKYNTFYEQFGKNIKLGVHEDSVNRTKLASLLRYESTKSESLLTSFEDYIGRMKEGQKGVYYITGESKKTVVNSPFLEKLKKRDIEVLYMVDALDEYVTQQLKEYGEHKLICITKENLDLPLDESSEKETFESLKKDYEKTCTYMKTVLGDSVEKVIVSNRLESSPCILATNQFGWTANMERIMKAQALGSNNSMSYMMSKKTMEINPYNNIVKRIHDKVNLGQEDRMLNDLIHLLYDVTLQSSGFSLDDPVSFSKRILKFVDIGLGGDASDASDDLDDVQNTDSQPIEDCSMEEVD
jgi:molecular chaperone HtpG